MALEPTKHTIMGSKTRLWIGLYMVIFCLASLSSPQVDGYLMPDFDFHKQEELFDNYQGNLNHEDATQRVPKMFNFGIYVDKYDKNYNGPTEALAKAKLFFARTLKIFKHNIMFMRQKVGYYLNQNQFTDAHPNELKELFVSQDLNIAPISEAHTSPDLPADRCPSVKRLMSETEAETMDEGYSQASLDDLMQSSHHPKESKVIERLDFMTDPGEEKDFGSLGDILHAIKRSPVNAAKLADQVERAAKTVEVAEQERIHEARRLVESKAVVASDNPDYKPQMTMSFAPSGPAHNAMKSFAKALMSDPEFNFDYEQSPDLAPKLESYKGRSMFGSILSSLYEFLGSMDADDQKIVEEPSKSDNRVADVPSFIQEPEQKQEPVFDVDWRLSGCISAVRNQKSCNSCYAFTVLSLLEYFYCRQTKKLTNFSAQYIIDCGSLTGLKGCESSRITNVGKFIKTYGLELEASYPYLAQDGKCPYLGSDRDPKQPLSKQMGYLKPTISHWQNFQGMADWYRWIRKSPIIVGINMPLDFLAYGGGIHDGLDCDRSMTHAMLLVGSGKQDGQEFWLMKNSFSEEWGEVGYFRLSKGAPLKCFNSAIVARAKFVDSG